MTIQGRRFLWSSQRGTFLDGKDLMDGIIDCYTKAKTGSIEKRVMMMFIANYNCHSYLKELWDSKPTFAMPFWLFSAGRSEYKLLNEGKPLPTNVHTVQRFDPCLVDTAVSFILSM